MRVTSRFLCLLGLLLFAGSAVQAQWDQVLYYPITDSLLKDESTNDYDGQSTNTIDTTNTKGWKSTALYFNGTDAYVEITNPNNNSTQPISNAEVPVRSHRLMFVPEDDSTLQCLFEFGGGGRGYACFIYNGKIYGGAWINGFASPADGFYEVLGEVTEGALHDFVWEWQKDSVMLAYINGTETYRKDNFTTLVNPGDNNIGLGALVANSVSPVDSNLAGATGNSGASNNFKGFIEEFSIKSRLLKTYEISDSLIAAYKFNQSAMDSTGNGWNGTVIGTLVDTTDYDTVRNEAYYFDNGGVQISAESPIANTAMPARAFEAFYKVDQSSTNRDMLIETGGNSSGADLYVENDTLYFHYYNDNAANSWVLKSPTVDSLWQHAVAQWDRQRKVMELYLGGKKVDSLSIDFTPYYGSGDMGIGKNFSETRLPGGEELTFDANFTGSIAEVVFYSATMSPKYIETRAALVDTATAKEPEPVSLRNAANQIGVSAFPNPATSQINLTDQVDRVILFTSKGQIVRNAERVQLLNVADLPRGMYLLRIEQGDSFKAKRILLK